MKVIVAGSRDLLDPDEVEDAIVWSPFAITELVCGMARGVDMNAYLWAKRNGIAVREFPADWDRLGLSAGPVRNEAMANYGEALIAIWDGVSSGTKDMIKRAGRHRLPVAITIRKFVVGKPPIPYRGL